MRVYLAGPVDPSLLDECISWRREATKMLAALNIEAQDPTRGGNHPKPTEDGTLGGFPVSAADLVARDKADIRRSDILLVYWPGQSDKRGIGTLMEIALAGLWQIPILLVDPGQQLAGHPWIEVHVTQNHASLAAAIDAIQSYWLLRS